MTRASGDQKAFRRSLSVLHCYTSIPGEQGFISILDHALWLLTRVSKVHSSRLSQAFGNVPIGFVMVTYNPRPFLSRSPAARLPVVSVMNPIVVLTV